MKRPNRYCEALAIGVDASLRETRAVRVMLGKETLSRGNTSSRKLLNSVIN